MFLCGTAEIHAIPPPDFLFNLGSQFVQVLSIVVIFLSSVIVSIHVCIKSAFAKKTVQVPYWVAIGVLVFTVSLFVASVYEKHRQSEEYQQLLAEKQYREEINAARKRLDVFTIEEVASNSFFDENSHIPLSISNDAFQSVLDGPEPVYVIDARESSEYDLGHFPGSIHIRFADLLAGEWISIPNDRVIYTICWSGTRGDEVVKFLRSKHIIAQYLENGFVSWVDDGGIWEGDTVYQSRYYENEYKNLYTSQELRKLMNDGAMLIDSRTKSKYDTWHFPQSMHLSIMYTPTWEIDKKIDQIPTGSRVAVVCDSIITCVDAKFVGMRLEASGIEFLGRGAIDNRPLDVSLEPINI